MSKSVLNAWDTGYIAPIAVCINQYFNYLIDEHVFLWFFLVSIMFTKRKNSIDKYMLKTRLKCE